MLIDLRELLSGSQDERIEKVSIESDSFDTGIAKYSILEKPEFELCITRIGKNKLEIKAESFVVLDIPCDRCLESVPTKVEYSVNEIVDFSDNAAGEEAKEEKDYIGGYELDVDRLVFGEILISMPGKHFIPWESSMVIHHLFPLCSLFLINKVSYQHIKGFLTVQIGRAHV